MTRWSGSTAGHGANVPPLLPSADKAINPGLLWASAALNLWAFTAYCSVGLTLPAGGSTLCTSRTGKEFKLRVKYVGDFIAMKKLNFKKMTMASSGLADRFPTGRMFLHWYANSHALRSIEHQKVHALNFNHTYVVLYMFSLYQNYKARKHMK